uniref:RRM domain-containing protein n=1 Tax=Chenopodium quinoa TaxID=63459 RepID=A0A803NBH2_CHEQI
MPPRTKKAAATPGKKTTRTSRTPAKSDDVKNEVLRVEINDDNVKVSEQNYSIDSSTDLNVEPLSESNGSFLLTKEDEVKEDEYEKDERLDLEDNEPEYEPEEYGDGYDEKEVDQEDFQEEEDEVVEEVEEGDLVEEEEEEEEGDMAEEDMEEVPEELEAEEDDEHTDAEEREHHELVKERRKRKEFEVFVGGLDKDATEEDLKEVFSVVGEVTEVRLMMNPQTKKNKGFAFLRFATVEQAKRAVLELKNPVVNGKQCGVTPSQDSDTLFLGNICKTWTKEKLKEKLKLYGIENIEDLTLVEDSNNEGKNRGFAFLEFSSRSEAMDAFKRLQKRDVLLGVERPAKVSFADSFIDPGDEIMAQVKTVFIDGLPASWDEDRVRILLKSFGEIEKVELARNMPSARRKDFGFVSFDSHDAAVTCAKSINNVELGEGDHKAKVRARLSRPLQRGKGKNHPRSDHKGGRVAGRRPRAPWNRPLPRPLPPRVRGLASRAPIAVGRGLKRPARARPLPPPPRPYDRRAPAPPPPKSSLKRDYIRREELPPRSRAVAEYGSRLPPERRPTYRDEYAARSPVYADVHRSSASRSATRRPYPEDKLLPQDMKDHLQVIVKGVHVTMTLFLVLNALIVLWARVDYDIPSGSSQYADTYGDRMGRSTAGYSGSSRSSISAQDSHGIYSSRQGMSYNGTTLVHMVANDGGMYSSSYGSEYPSRGSDVGGSSYSSLYSGRGVSGSGYMGGGSSGSYY